MDLLPAIILLTLFAFLLYRRIPKKECEIPAVSLLEYLPNGVLYPIWKDPLSFMRTMEVISDRYGHVFYSWVGLNPILVTSVPDDVAQVVGSEVFGRGQLVQQLFETVAPGGLFSSSGEKHHVAKRVMRDHFNVSMLESFETPMNNAVAELCADLTHSANSIGTDGKSPVMDISEVLSMTTFRVITSVGFGTGMDKQQCEKLARTALLYFEEGWAEIVGYPIRQYLTFLGIRRNFFKYKAEFDLACRKFIRKRMAEPKEEREARNPDILDVFVSMNPNDEDLVTALVFEFTVAGSHTTSQTLAWSIYETCREKRVEEKISRELDSVLGQKPLDEAVTLQDLQKLHYINNVWRETLRLHPVTSGFLRLTTEEETLKGSGVRVPKGTNILGHMRVHTDPTIWSQPDAFVPERWGHGNVRGEGDRVPATAYIPFGLGSRSCAGRFLAEYEGPLIMAELHRRFRFSLACKPEEVVNCSSFVETPRCASKKGGAFDMGVPVRVELKHNVAIS